MSIGSNIKRLRQEKDLTQEQLAEYLGITSRAVSQWECNRTAPDISQLPVLCHIFDVSSDTLLGIDIEKNNEEINRYMDKATKELSRGNFEYCAAILREALRKFPKSYAIMIELAHAIICANVNNCMEDYNEVFALCNRVLGECTDSIRRYEALQTLARAYGRAGRQEEMRKLAEEMPNLHFSQQDFMRYRWKGDADFEKIQGYMDFLIGRTIEMLGITATQQHDNNEFIYSPEDRIRLQKTRISLLELLFPDGDYLFYGMFGDQACSYLCNAYLEKQDYEEAWYWLEKRVDFVIHTETYDSHAAHTSPILRNVVPGGWVGLGGDFSEKILDWLATDETCAVLRSDERYEHLVNRLKAIVKKS